jgi:cell division topological specificity factor
MAGLLDFIKNSFGAPKQTTASLAKERLQIIIARENADSKKDFLPELEKELVAVIRKYVKISDEDIKVSLNKQGDLEILDVNIVIDDKEPSNDKEVKLAV